MFAKVKISTRIAPLASHDWENFPVFVIRVMMTTDLHFLSRQLHEPRALQVLRLKEIYFFKLEAL